MYISTFAHQSVAGVGLPPGSKPSHRAALLQGQRSGGAIGNSGSGSAGQPGP